MDLLPPYESSSLPIYSPSSAGSLQLSSNCVQAGACEPVDGEYIYTSDRLQVKLGSRRWATCSPLYGRHGVVEGTVMIRKKCRHVVNITATLEGRVSLTITETPVRSPVAVVGPGYTPIMENRVVLFESFSEKGAIDEGDEYQISIPFPTCVSGGDSALPPTYAVTHQGAFCSIEYRLRVDMVRKGLRMHERVSIPVLYLPRTRPSLPTLLEVVPRDPIGSSSETDRMATIELTKSRIAKDALYDCSIHLTLPRPSQFVAGEVMPLALTISCEMVPAIPDYLAKFHCVTIELVKCSRVWVCSGWSTRESVLSTAECRRVDSSVEGVSVSYWALQVGNPQEPASLRLDGILDLSFMIRVQLKPPHNVAIKLLAMRHDEPVMITSDPWVDPVIAEATSDYPALGPRALKNGGIRLKKK